MWSGVRPYKQPDGTTIRVLHRPEQVESPKNLARLRSLTATQGHPKGDVNLSPANVEALAVGYTGDTITIEVIKGYRCPVARVVAQRRETIERILNGATQTSLGYTALWVSPADDELGTDPQTGRECGVWAGPYGPEYYDLEHILDPDCQLVVDLAAKGFDADQLGANHYGIALDAGRGGVQSELMRVVDSIDLSETLGEPTIDATAPAPASEWTVSTSEALPFAPVDATWDGDAAAASVFAWAGFDTDKPDASKARQAFLVHDASRPELRGSYKLPIARVENGELQVVKAGLDAAASYLPQTDIPQPVRDRARKILDSYYSKFAESFPSPARDAQPENRTMTTPADPIIKHAFTLAPSRDLAAWAAKNQFKLAAPIKLEVSRDEVDPEMIMAFVASIEECCAMMREKLGSMEVEIEDLGVDKKALEDAVAAKMAELDEAKVALAAAGDAMKKTCDEVTAARDSLLTERDALLTEVAPLRQAEIDRVRSIAAKAGVAKDALDRASTIPALRRATVLARCPEQAVHFANASDDAISSVYLVVSQPFTNAASSPNPTAPKTPTAPMPKPKLVTPTDQADVLPSKLDQAFNAMHRVPAQQS